MAIREDPLGYSVDKYTGATKTVTNEHHEIHDGKHYFIASYTQLNAGASTLFGFTTADEEEEVHIVFGFVSTGQTLFEMYEDCDFDVSSSVVAAVNSNRNSSNVSSASIQKSSSMNSWGTKRYDVKIGITSNPVSSIGGDHRSSDEIVLKRNTKYTYRFESFSASNIISYKSTYYHEKPKES